MRGLEGDSRQGLRTLRAGAKTETFQPSSLITDDNAERPLAFQRLNEPRELLVVRAIDVRLSFERRRPLLCRADDDRHAEIMEVIPLGDLIRPRALSHAQRRDDKRRTGREEVPDVAQCREGGYRLAGTHPRPHHSPRTGQDVVNDEPLVGAGDELLAHNTPAR